GHALDQENVATNCRSCTDHGFTPKDGRIRIDGNIILHCGVSFTALFDFAVLVFLKAARAECDTVIKFHTGTNLGGLADYHAGAVIDKKVRADFRPRMNVDPSPAVRPFGHDARNERHLVVKQVRHSMNGDGLERGISEYDFFITCRSWVSFICSIDVCPKKSAHRGQVP